MVCLDTTELRPNKHAFWLVIIIIFTTIISISGITG